MKKYFLTAAALLLLSPLTASADLVATGDMKVVASTPTQYVDFDGQSSIGSLQYLNYYADYDATFGAMTLKPAYTTLTFDSGEVFCVENTDMYTEFGKGAFTTYDFYTSDALNSWEKDSRAIVTWIANWATTTTSYDNYTTDQIKAIGQVAIWDIVISSAAFSGGYYSAAQTLINTIYAGATNKDAFVNDWLLAVSPSGGTLGDVKNYQNFLVKATATPVPEPGTMFLFGTGLAGLAAVSRRRRS